MLDLIIETLMVVVVLTIVILHFKYASILIAIRDAQEGHHVDMLTLMVVQEEILEEKKEEVVVMAEEVVVIAIVRTEKIAELRTPMTVVDLLPLEYAMPFKKVIVIEVVPVDTLMMVVQVIVVVICVQITVTSNAMLLLEVNAHVVAHADSNIN